MEDRFSNFDSAVHFDGIDDYIDIGQSVFNLSSELTIALWVKLDGANGSYQTFIRKGVTINPFSLRLSGTRIQGGIRTGSTTYVLGSGIINYGDWRHVALTYKSGSLTLYLDGLQDGVAPSTALQQPATMSRGSSISARGTINFSCR
jgi:hypothetical protein